MIKGGKKQERHLCERCAKELGVSPAAAGPPLTQLLTQIITSQTAHTPHASSTPVPGAEAAKPGQSTHCAACGLPYSQFRASGLLGCPECYRAFEGLLAPLLARAHEGGTHHVGRQPQRSRPATAIVGPHAPNAAGQSAPPPAASYVELPDGSSAGERVVLLSRQLAEAVAAEQYERAAKLRDELLRCQSGVFNEAHASAKELSPQARRAVRARSASGHAPDQTHGQAGDQAKPDAGHPEPGGDSRAKPTDGSGGDGSGGAPGGGPRSGGGGGPA